MLRMLVAGLAAALALGSLSAEDSTPKDDPAAGLKLPWTGTLRWSAVVDVTRMPGASAAEKLAAAQAQLAAKGGGVVYFPPGVYTFTDHVKLRDGIILRGAPPKQGAKATDDDFTLPTHFEFPRYQPAFEGGGTPNDTAFKGIYLEDPSTASSCGLVHLDIHRGHVHFEHDGSEEKRCGKNRLVLGCILRNTAVPDPAVPSAKVGQ